MNCGICRRPYHAQKRPFLCAVDVRNTLYEGRIAHAQLLLENEDLEKQVNLLLSDATTANKSTSDAATRTARVATCESECQQALDATAKVEAQAAKLRAQVEAARKEIEEKKAALARRKADLDSAADGLQDRRSKQLGDTQKSTQTLSRKWDSNHQKLAGTRAFLCTESAKLFGLRRTKKPSQSRYEYQLGGVEIINLQALNDLSHEVISTSLAHIAHILVLASHYLAIRLPAEITLPHKNYPRPTVFNFDSSYRHRAAKFPGTAELPEGSRAKPRPLYLDKPLRTLAKDDPTAYSYFLEGVSLLAYDIVWACNTQGVQVGDKESIDDFCNLGRNLYDLLIGNPLHTNVAGRIFQIHAVIPNGGASGDAGNATADIGQATMGRYSHGAAHDFLCSAEGTEFLKKMKLRLQAPKQITDKLKRKLNPVSEWEVIEHVTDNLAETFLVPNTGRTSGRRSSFGVESVSTEVGSIAESDAASTKSRATGPVAAWTRLRNR